MKVLVKFFVFDLPPGFEDAEFSLSEGATVNDLFDECLELFKVRQVSMDENELRTATVMLNGKWSNPSDVIPDGAVISVIRPMDGG